MDSLSDLTVFTRIVDLSSLSAAGRDLGLSPAVVSKRLKRLEDRLGVRLVNRTTRRLHPTEDGEAFYARCVAILAQVEAAEAAVSSRRETLRGTLRVATPASFGRKHVAPAIADFRARYPQIRISLHLSDQMVDLVEEGLDLAIRIADLADSAQIARRLADNRRVVCAAPAYIARFGAPRHPRDLADHACLVLRYPGSPQLVWRLSGPDGDHAVPIGGPLETNNGEVITEWLRAGLGLALRSTWDVGEDLKSGRLVPVLAGYAPATVGIHAVMPRGSAPTPRVRAFVDFLAARIGRPPYWDRDLAL